MATVASARLMPTERMKPAIAASTDEKTDVNHVLPHGLRRTL